MVNGNKMTYEELLIEADSEGLLVREKPLVSSDGRIKGKRIAIRSDIPTLAKKPMFWLKKWDIIIRVLEIF